MSFFEALNLPGDVTVLLYSIGIILILAYFCAGKDFGIIKIPEFELGRQRIAGLSGVALLAFCVVAGLPLFEKEDDSGEEGGTTRVEQTCHPKIFATGGGLNDFNEIGLWSGYSSRVIRGGNQTIKLDFRDEVDLLVLSCVQILICRPIDANSCATIMHEFRPVNGHQNSFSFPIFDNFEPGPHRIHVKLIRVQSADQLEPDENGSFALSDYQLYGESREFEVANP